MNDTFSFLPAFTFIFSYIIQFFKKLYGHMLLVSLLPWHLPTELISNPKHWPRLGFHTKAIAFYYCHNFELLSDEIDCSEKWKANMWPLSSQILFLYNLVLSRTTSFFSLISSHGNLRSWEFLNSIQFKQVLPSSIYSFKNYLEVQDFLKGTEGAWQILQKNNYLIGGNYF